MEEINKPQEDILAKVKVLVYSERIKETLHLLGCKADGKFVEALSQHVQAQVRLAVLRAKSNGRCTVRPGDL